MEKNKINVINNLLMALLFFISLFSGIILLKFLPSGQGFRGGQNIFFNDSTFLNFSRHIWLKIHNISSLILAVLIIIHFFVLHWTWLKLWPKIFKGRG